MTQDTMYVTGYGKVHIDIILTGAKVTSDNFRHAMNVASMERLRRIIGDLEARPHQMTRIKLLRARLEYLTAINATLAEVV